MSKEKTTKAVNTDSNKEKALAAAFSKIEEQFGKGSVMKLGDYKTMNVEAISTGSLSLDMALRNRWNS